MVAGKPYLCNTPPCRPNGQFGSVDLNGNLLGPSLSLNHIYAAYALGQNRVYQCLPSGRSRFLCVDRAAISVPYKMYFLVESMPLQDTNMNEERCVCIHCNKVYVNTEDNCSWLLCFSCSDNWFEDGCQTLLGDN
jgi:hypothetical protein